MGGVSSNDVGTPIEILERYMKTGTEEMKTGTESEKALLDMQPTGNSVNLVKKTFTVGGGDTPVDIVRVKKCIFGNGRCSTHDVKLDRTVKNKKYSVMGAAGKLEWKYRDVTCLVCPNKTRGGFVIVGEDQENSEAVGKKSRIEK